MTTHLAPAPPTLTEDELAAARWADDGGPAYDPPPDPHTGEWMRISAALTGRLPEIAGRDDVLVTCRPGTRCGGPAAFYPTTAELELDAACFTPITPKAIQPATVGDEDKYRAAWGALIHEAAHAAHSHWVTGAPSALRGSAVWQAAELLEESRAEHAHLARRPADRTFLRACIRTLVMDSIASGAGDSPWQAAWAAGLLLARRDAGILDPDETAALDTLATSILGVEKLAELATIWTAAHATGDRDHEAMLGHARAWCEVVGTAPDRPAPPIPGTSGGNQASARVAEAMRQAVGRVTGNEQAETDARAQATAAAEARARDKAATAAQRRQAEQTAKEVFKPGRTRPFSPDPADSHRVRTPVTGTRAPTAAEKSAAGQLARALRAAAFRERAVTTAASALPPGQLHMRAALARDAQQAAGAVPSAQPWITTRRRTTPTPPLRVGIALDVSGSMSAATAPIASAAWILAKATALTDPNSRTATVAYNRGLSAITTPGRAPAQVTSLNAGGGGHRLAEAIDALTAGLQLTAPGAGRLLVIASDGRYADEESARAAARVGPLARAGCAVLWLAFAPDPSPLPGIPTVVLTDPARAVAVIAKAATTVLARTA